MVRGHRDKVQVTGSDKLPLPKLSNPSQSVSVCESYCQQEPPECSGILIMNARTERPPIGRPSGMDRQLGRPALHSWLLDWASSRHLATSAVKSIRLYCSKSDMSISIRSRTVPLQWKMVIAVSKGEQGLSNS